MVIAVAVLAALAFIVWLIIRAVKSKGIKAHFISYGISIIAGVFTYAYFLSLDFSQLIKIIGSIAVGIVLIVFGALYQRRRAAR